jgi:hypothetical protein
MFDRKDGVLLKLGQSKRVMRRRQEHAETMRVLAVRVLMPDEDPFQEERRMLDACPFPRSHGREWFSLYHPRSEGDESIYYTIWSWLGGLS